MRAGYPANNLPLLLPLKPQVAQLLVPTDSPLEVTIESGLLLTEVRQSWAPWASLVTRLWSGADWIEQEWTVGPIPADGVGKEITVRTSTDLQTGASVR
jgi:hypothetical protein